MPATPADLFALLDRLGIICTTVPHPPLFTVEQSRAMRGAIAGAHTKNLFLRDKGGAFYLVATLEDATIDLKALGRALGARGRLSFGSGDDMRQVLGIEPGSVTPFAAMNDHNRRVTVVLDTAMLAHKILNYHPLVNTMTTAISSDNLLAFLRATAHAPRVIALGVQPLASPA